MSYYNKHVFICCNQRDGGRECCNGHGATRIQKYAKQRIHELGLSGIGKVRVNIAGCLDRCHLGPVMVIYPEGTWYTYVDEQDVDEIIAEHIQNGSVVGRLVISDLS